MRKTLAVVGAALALALSSAAHAGAWRGPLTVVSGFTEDSDAIVIYTAETAVLTPGCVGGSWVFSAANEDRRGRAWATILTAISSGMKVMLWDNGVCGAWSFHQATAIRILK